MKNNTLILIFLIFFELNAQQILKVKSANISFTIKNAGLKVNGTFEGLLASIYFNQNELSKAKIEASVDAKTIQTGIKARDNHLKNEDYFDIEKFPKITLVLIDIITKKDNTYISTFELGIKKSKKKVSIPFTFLYNTFKGNFEINRKDFEVGGNSWILSDKVLISFEIIVE